MCKFTNRLFVLVLLQFIGLAMAKPLKTRSSASDLIELLYNDYGDYGYQLEEVNYDQRQKGEENLKLRLDGFLIGLPARDDSSWLDLLAEEYLSNALPKKPASPESGKSFQTLAEKNITDATTAAVVNMPGSKKDIESRQHVNDDVPSSPRTKSHILQLLQMFRRTQI
ncbi:uncharacterized protein [Drosophila virilis]|uniref:uncharacterized protein n=1 Tax=Drosophila virilis TaxID=7244 RepID=UPI00017D573C|nr:uncharacterized protein LOC6633939 isoform X2 [Drosophila virilis]